MEQKRTIRIIPKKIDVINSSNSVIKKKVAAYARVSTDMEDQRNSLSAQLDEYKFRIQSNPEWEFVDLYYDEGISGTYLEKREGFKRMIKDAKNGLIELILVKSISRFARNTVDCLKTIRELKSYGVGVLFDKEHINSLDENVEFQITLFGSIAQEESKNISQAVKWGVRSRMKRGDRKMVVKTTLGYEYNENGEIIINEPEAELVRSIFTYYISGFSIASIADLLTKSNFKTGTGKTKWLEVDVKRILTDEKYIGLFIMQKTVVVDFLDHKAKKNDGLVEKYIVENHHPSIIEKDKFDFVQNKLKLSKNKKEEKQNLNPLNGLIVCSDCLRFLKKIKIHPNKKWSRYVLTCKTARKDDESYKKCDVQSTLDYDLVLSATNLVFSKFIAKSTYSADFLQQKIKETLTFLNEKRTTLKEEITTYQKRIQEILQNTIYGKGNITESPEFTNANRQLMLLKQSLNKLDEDLMVASSNFKDIQEHLNFHQYNLLSSRLLKMYFALIVRRPDNSIRYLIGKPNFDINKNTIKKLLKLEPSYSGFIDSKEKILSFDVVILGE